MRERMALKAEGRIEEARQHGLRRWGERRRMPAMTRWQACTIDSAASGKPFPSITS